MQTLGPKKGGMKADTASNMLANGRTPLLEDNLDADRYQQMREMFAKHENTSLILTFTRDPDNTPYLEKLLTDSNEDVRKVAAFALTHGFAERKEWENVNRMLAHPAASIKANSIKALKDMAESEDISPVVASLAGPLVDPNEGVRMMASETLINAALNEDSRSTSMAILASALSNRNDAIKILVSEALENLTGRKVPDGNGGEKLIDPTSVIPTLGNVLLDPSKAVRRGAAKALVRCAENPNPIVRTTAVTMLTNALSSKDPTVQLDSLEAISDAAGKGVDIALSVPALGSLLTHKKDNIRVASSTALRRFGENGFHVASALDSLANALSDKNPDVRTNCEWTLGFAVMHKDTSERAITILGNTLADTKEYTRHHAILALWNALTNEGTRAKGLAVFKNALESEDPKRDDMRIDATLGLSNAAEKGVMIAEVLPSLGKMLVYPNKDVRRNAADALMFASMKETREECLDILSDALQSKDKNARVNAMRAIADAAERKVCIESIMQKTAQMLSNRDKEARRESTRALGYAALNGTDLSSVMESVSRAVIDPDKDVRRNAVWAVLNNAEKGGDISLALGNLGKALSVSG